MDDFGSSGTRKRPRLDSGELSFRGLSADGSSPRPEGLSDSAGLIKAQGIDAQAMLHSSKNEVSSAQGLNPSNPSKVTINVRETAGGEEDRLHNANISVNDTSSTMIEQHDINAEDEGSPRIESVHSTPRDSPEVQIVEIEDVTDGPAVIEWTSSDSSNLGARAVQQQLLLEFPYRSRETPLRKLLGSIATTWEKGDLSSAVTLSRMISWITRYIERTESFADQWWDLLSEEREFWEELPLIAEGLSRRADPALEMTLEADDTNDDAEILLSKSPVTGFIMAWASITFRMLQIDQHTLRNASRETASSTPDMISDRYVAALAHFMSSNASIWRTNASVVRVDPWRAVHAITAHFVGLGSGSSIELATDVAQRILDMPKALLHLAPKYGPLFWLPMQIAQNCQAIQVNDATVQYLNDTAGKLIRSFQTLQSSLLTLINKQSSGLTITLCQWLTASLAGILSNLTLTSEEMMDSFFTERDLDSSDLPAEDSADLIQLAWKFEIWRKCIIEGRMEIRAQGAEAMSTELLSCHKKYVEGCMPAKIHPVARYLSNFIYNTRLIQYIVSVESHPQLVQRSPNILGFLVVTGNFNDSDANHIWTAAISSSDPRSSEAIIHMLLQVVSLCDRSMLLYLVRKLQAVSVESFDNKMMLFGQRLLEVLRKKWSDEEGVIGQLDAPPYDLCVELIRRSAPDSSLSPKNGRPVHDWAKVSLQMLLPYGPTPQTKQRIFVTCIEDISRPCISATGSTSAVLLMLGEDKGASIADLTQNLALTQVIVSDLDRLVEKDDNASLPETTILERLAFRLDLLYFILLTAPDSLENTQAQKLWDSIVGKKAINDAARNSAWHIIIGVARHSRKRNSFIDLCISQFLPSLESSYLVAGSLDFADIVKQYLNHSTSDDLINGNRPRLTAAELLWHLTDSVPYSKLDMEVKAIEMLVAYYLDSPDMRDRSSADTENIHAELVNRCIGQLTKSATELKVYDDSTFQDKHTSVMIVGDATIRTAARNAFTRALKILREFITGIRSRPIYSPPPRCPAILPKDFENIKGKPIPIKYQAFSGSNSTREIKTFEAGGKETVAKFSDKLKLLTAFDNFSVIAGGQKIDLESILMKHLEEVDFHSKGLLLIKKTFHADTAAKSVISGLRPVELQVMQNFAKLKNLLAMESSLASQVYEFLISFPPDADSVSKACSGTSLAGSLTVYTRPYKLLYLVYVMRTNFDLHFELRDDVDSTISHGILVMINTIIDINLQVRDRSNLSDIIVAEGLMDCLAHFLKASQAAQSQPKVYRKEDFPEVSAAGQDRSCLIQKPIEITQYCLSILESVSLSITTNEEEKLVTASFTIIVEVITTSPESWTTLKNASFVPSLLYRLLLETPRESVRNFVGKTIKGVCQPLSSTNQLPIDIRQFLWHSLAPIITTSQVNVAKTEPFFDVMQTILISLPQESQAVLDLTSYATQWMSVLMNHSAHEAQAVMSINHFVYGLTRLLVKCLQVIEAGHTQSAISFESLEQMMQSHLFPKLDDTNRFPNLHPATREQLYSLTLLLTKQLKRYETVLGMTQSFYADLNNDLQAWSWGIAPPVDDPHYDHNWTIDLPKIIRATAGYPGLRNLSNTCYMNSLFAQLFMNINFRSFILDLHITDGDKSQKLLRQTQRLFGLLQASMLKSVDTQVLADSITTYENTPIDVTHQVDVDEFFNLLFDRIESQIQGNEDKRKFRNFFGGQIVQQIKSKECSHISERLEPFSAIQCEISGKKNLAESLQAYVQGEAMEGDNKYSCTSCGKYVDAVKRACLKDIPDNLIFHLKRFDYDLMHGTRKKINERFEFPREIDMSEYKVEHLQNPKRSSSPDLFALVGVLIHSGTAESGHYYSYVQDRSVVQKQPKWVEFNDIDVSEFDPASIDDTSFGGWIQSEDYQQQYAKLWNAYMLFFERIPQSTSSTISTPSPAKNLRPVLPTDLQRYIDSQNQAFLRRYCMHDRTYTDFWRGLLGMLAINNGATCSGDHVCEDLAIGGALEHLTRVLARTKDEFAFEEILATMIHMASNCSICCKGILEWIIGQASTIPDMILLCPHAIYRKNFAELGVLALSRLREKAPATYGFDSDSHQMAAASSTGELRGTPFTFYQTIQSLRNIWESIHMYTRAWEEYFGLLYELAKLGHAECHVILRLGFLESALELLICEQPSARHLRVRSPYLQFARMVEKGRKIPLNRLLDLVAVLIETIDLRDPGCDEICGSRPYDTGLLLPTKTEIQYLQFCGPGAQGLCLILERILNINGDSLAAKRIVAAMTATEMELEIGDALSNTIKSGISVEPAYQAGPFLTAALTYCEITSFGLKAEALITEVANEVHSIGRSGGREHLDFFRLAYRLRNPRIDNSHSFFARLVLRTISLWAPCLLTYCEVNIRKETLQLIGVILFKHDINDMDDEELADELRMYGQKLCISCAKKCQAVVEDGKPVGRIMDEICIVIEECLSKYFDEEENRETIDGAQDILARLTILTDSDIEDSTTRWANQSDDLPSDSESDEEIISDIP